MSFTAVTIWLSTRSLPLVQFRSFCKLRKEAQMPNELLLYIAEQCSHAWFHSTRGSGHKVLGSTRRPELSTWKEK
eukprot:924093-Amphidinium_carterae.1